MKYVFLDTCVIVDCAFTRKEKSSPKLLERLMGRLRENGVKLILPEVVQLELEKVLPQTMSVAVESFGAVKKSVQEVAENSLLSHSAKTKLLDAVKAARAELNSDVNDALDLINHISNESDKCVVLPLIQEDIIVATKMAIKGNKPSKSKAEWGLVQEDCLIIAALERLWMITRVQKWLFAAAIRSILQRRLAMARAIPCMNKLPPDWKVAASIQILST